MGHDCNLYLHQIFEAEMVRSGWAFRLIQSSKVSSLDDLSRSLALIRHMLLTLRPIRSPLLNHS